jgi:hypothetical protein
VDTITVQRERCRGNRIDCAKCIALDTGDLNETPDWIVGHAKMVVHSDLVGISICSLVPPSAATRPALAMLEADPTSP